MQLITITYYQNTCVVDKNNLKMKTFKYIEHYNRDSGFNSKTPSFCLSTHRPPFFTPIHYITRR